MLDESQTWPTVMSPDGTVAYAAGIGGISVIDIATDALIATISTGEKTVASGLVTSPDGCRVYVAVASTHDGDVDVIDTATNENIDTIHLGEIPGGITISSDGGTLYVTDAHHSVIEAIAVATGAITKWVSVERPGWPNDIPVHTDQVAP